MKADLISANSQLILQTWMFIFEMNFESQRMEILTSQREWRHIRQ